jgi:hypothetical protein
MELEFDFSGNKNPKIKSLVDDTTLKFYLSKKDLSDYEAFVDFINGVMAMVRKDPRYTNYKHALYELGLNRCQIHADITSDMVDIELHHGPLFSLFDVCTIVTDDLFSQEKNVNTFMVADIVLTEHEKHNVQSVMLCETCHEAAENGSIFLAFEHGFGHIDKFIKKYKDGVSNEHLNLLKEYVKLSKEYGTVDNGVYEILDKVKKYIK